MSHPRISVLLPVFNAEDTLHTAIESIINQSEQALQLVIVDDGSGDSSADIINQWASRDARIDAIFNNHQGIVPALNAGIQKAKAKYVARMDGDDVSLPNRLKLQADYLDRHPETGLVSCFVEHWGNRDQQRGYARYVDWINSLTSHEDIALRRFIESPLAHPSVMFRKTLIDNHGSYRRGNFPEDYELWLRWLEHGVRMEKLPETLLKWRDEPDRLSRNHDRYSRKAFYQTKSRYLSNWLKKNNPHHPKIVVWGAGQSSRKRADLLTHYGIKITHYVDVDPNKVGQEIHGRTVWGPDEIPEPGSHFIISYVGNRGVNKEIRYHLQNLEYSEGKDFLFAA